MKIEHLPINKLKPNPDNPRFIRDEKFKSLVKSLKDCPDLFEARPCICSDRTGELIIIGGNMRWRSAKELKWKEVPVIIMPGLTEAQEKEIAIRDNGAWGEWDFDLLSAWSDLPLDDWGVDLPSGWTEPEANPGLTDPDDIPEEPEEPITKPGDLWILGEHRLLCGDSTKAEDVERVMRGEKADMIFTDPPYGVSYVGINNPNGKNWGRLKNDELRGGQLEDFLTKVFKNMFLYSNNDTALYCWHASSTQIQFEHALNLSGFEVKQQLIWNKGMVLGHSDYHWAHEPLFYCRKIGQKTNWYGTRTGKTVLGQRRTELQKLKKEALLKIVINILDESTTWEIDRDLVKTYQHSTQKPVRLAVKAIINNSIDGNIVMDFFVGSGTTIIACEQLNRKCRAIEISPTYCDVAVKRWEDFTGKKAELAA